MIDHDFILALLKQKTFDALKISGIKKNMILDEKEKGGFKGKQIFKFILSHFKKHGKMPSRKTIHRITRCKLSGKVKEPFRFYADLVLERHKRNLIGDHLDSMAEQYETGNLSKAMKTAKAMVSTVNELGQIDADEGLIDLTKTSWKRHERYEEMKELKGKIAGIPTPWPTINEITRGILRGTYWMVLGAWGRGKTWISIIMAHHAWINGYKPLLITMEDSVEIVAQRFDAVNANIPYNDLRKGTLDSMMMIEFAGRLDEMKKSQSIWIVGDARINTMEDVELITEELKPDLLIVDGLYMLADESRYKKYNEAVSAVGKGLLRLAKGKKLPVVGTSQFDAEITENKRGHGKNTAYSKDLIRSSRVALEVHRSKELEKRKQCVIGMLKHNEGIEADVLIEWDDNRMDFQELRRLKKGEKPYKRKRKIDEEEGEIEESWENKI